MQVETTDGREIGRVYFTLESVALGARALERELD